MAKASDFSSRTMAEDILSQEEVDALLRGVGGKIDESARPNSDAAVRPYDIARQERIVRGHMPGLELINERFTGLLRAGLFDFMRKDTEISAGPVRAFKYSEFVRALVIPTNLNLVQIKPLKGRALIVFEPALVSQVVECLFGGQGRSHTRAAGWSFTPTEMRVIQRMLQVVFEQYQRAWQPVFDLTLEHIRSETNTQFAAIATPAEMVVASSFSIDLAGVRGDFHVCIPYAMLEPIRDLMHGSAPSDRSEQSDRWTSLLSAEVYHADVELKVNLARAEVTVRQLLGLRPGDVIAVDLPEVLVAEVDGVPVLEGGYGVMNGQYALKVARLVGGERDGGQ
jgi:flagellar motor switch protein FliM